MDDASYTKGEGRARHRLTTMPLFEGADPHLIDDLFAGARIERHKAGDMIISFQDTTNDVFFVIEGSVSVSICSDSGKEVFFREVTAGDYFGEFSAIDNQPRSATIYARAQTMLLRVRGELFLKLVKSSPSIAMHLMRSLVRRNRQLTDRILANAAQDVPTRIRCEVYRLALAGQKKGIGAMIDAAPSHYEIATRVGTHREAVSRELSRLARIGVVECGRRRIAVPDMSRLAALAEPP